MSHECSQQTHWTFLLPSELLCQIFYFSLSPSPFRILSRDNYGDITLSLGLSNMTTPFTLGAVCRYWRDIAFQYPQLWRSIYFVANPRKASIQAMLLREWLARTGMLPLAIEVDCSDDDHKKWTSQYAGQALLILQIIYEYSFRCTSFHTRLPPTCLLLPPAELCIPDPRFDNLKTLEIAPFSLTEGVDDEDSEDLDIISVFQHSRQLRYLALWEIRIEQLELPWSSLALITISTRTLSLYDNLVLLRNAPNVQEYIFMTVAYSDRSSLGTLPDSNILLPQLHTLSFDFTELESGFDIIFDYIIAPNLRKLRYLSQEGRDFPTEKFQLFQDRSKCSLVHLEIKGPAMTAPVIWTCLHRYTQSLEYLVVDIPTENDEEIISVQPKLDTVFPRMRAARVSAPSYVIQTLFSSPK